MRVIKGVLLDEKIRLERLRDKYMTKLDGLPKGSINIRHNKSGEYAYLGFRDKDKVVSKYIGRSDRKEVGEIQAKLIERKKIASKLKDVVADIRDIEKVLGGRKI